jgi:hypothetical protein
MTRQVCGSHTKLLYSSWECSDHKNFHTSNLEGGSFEVYFNVISAADAMDTHDMKTLWHDINKRFITFTK